MGGQVSKPTTIPESKFYPSLVASLERLDGKTFAITGCTSGTGLVLAKTVGKLGAKVVMLNRKSERADAALQQLVDMKIHAELVICDLSSFKSVREAITSLLLKYVNGIDVLCNNAGIMGMPDAATEDGYDTQMQSNHLSHFLLTSGVWPLLEKAASLRGEGRVCNHSSGARNKPAGDLEARYLQKNGGNLGGDFWSMAKWYRYKQSKLANLLFTYSLHSKASEKGSKVKVVCAHPGATLTNLQMKTAQAGGQSYLDAYILNSTMARAHSEEDGTCGIIKACCLPTVNSGDFYGPEPVLSVGEALLLPAERNNTGEELLWAESMTATGATWSFSRS